MIAKVSWAVAGARYRLFRGLVLILALVGLMASSRVLPAAGVVHGHGLLWQVDRPGYWPSYVFGTMHSDDRRVLDLPLPVRAHFHRAKRLVVEANMHPADIGRLRSMRAMLFSKGQRLSEVLDPPMYRQTLAAMQSSGYPEPVVEYMKPWAVSTLLTLPRPTTGMFLDLYLVSEAHRRGKPVHGLETMEEQLSAMENLSLADQKVMLAEALKQLPRLRALHERLTRAYLRRDLEQLTQVGYESLDSRGLADPFSDHLINKRNVRMVDRMEPLLRRGKAFVAVGALHLPGDSGILALLERRGYRVTPLY